ncbi:MAG: 23S rRNA (guanosine(2251)-2'-O)-methyltransferase RlmB [Gammaproteobacteria bacterium]|nr:23S rRNA (guanosine(2251)-2'-O)-methyltransferase RlmB [Gammaproteobacteria bacterium]
MYGLHSVGTVLARTPERLIRVLVDAQRRDRRLEQLRAAVADAGLTLEVMAASELDRLAEGAVHQGVLAEVAAREPMDEHALMMRLEACAHPPLVLVLDGVQDPRNLGACLRSADAAGVDAVVIPMRRAASLTAAAIKTASGAAANVQLAQVVNLARVLRALREQGLRIIGAAGDAPHPVWSVELTGPLALVMGGEGEGLRHLTRQHCDAFVRLPMAGVVESLNVSVATGVCLYEALRQRRGAPG